MKKEQAQKKLKRNKGRHRKIHKNAPFLGENRVVLAKAKTKKQKTKQNIKKKENKNKEGLGPSEVALWATSPDP